MATATTVTFQFRRAHVDDLPSVAEIYNYAVRDTSVTFDTEEKAADHFRAFVSGHDSHRLLVAEALEEDGSTTIVGYGGVHPFKERKAYSQTAELTLYVHPKWQGRGIGSGLMDEIHRGDFLQGLHTILGLIEKENLNSRRLVEKRGYIYRGEMIHVGFKFGKYRSVTIYQRDV